MASSPTSLRGKLESIGQTNVLRFLDQLNQAGHDKLGGQLEALDLNNIAKLADEYVRRKPEVKLPSDIQPVKAFPRTPDAANRQLYQDAERKGRELLSQG